MTAKFASITAALLARKGEAAPWTESPAKTPLAWRTEPPMDAPASPPPPPPRERSCAVKMSAHDYERLGIIAVKTGTSRQQLLKQALEQFLGTKARALSCACLDSGKMGACENRCET